MKTGYYVKRKSNDPIIVSPYQDPKTAESWDMMENFSWVVGNTLETDELNMLDTFAFKQIDRGIDRWIQDAKYFPRLFISAAAFLVVYFAFSYAVRDPIPVIDELLLGLAAAAGVWIVMDKRAVKSDASIKRRLSLKQRLSNADLRIDQSISEIETWIDDMSALSVLDLSDCIVRSGQHDLSPMGNLPDSFFSELLEQYCKINIPKLMAIFPRVDEARQDTDVNIKLNGLLVEEGQKRPADLVLFALFIAVKEKSR